MQSCCQEGSPIRNHHRGAGLAQAATTVVESWQGCSTRSLGKEGLPGGRFGGPGGGFWPRAGFVPTDAAASDDKDGEGDCDGFAPQSSLKIE